MVRARFVFTFVGSRIFGVKGAYPLDECLHATFLEDSHEGRLESFASSGRYFGDGGFGRTTLLDVAASYLLELEVSGDVGRDENVGELS